MLVYKSHVASMTHPFDQLIKVLLVNWVWVTAVSAFKTERCILLRIHTKQEKNVHTIANITVKTMASVRVSVRVRPLNKR